MLIVNNKILNLPIRKLFPTPIASSYGMNFEFMPELKWSFGYPGAIIFMILTGLAPYLYFKRKNWL
nr:magnesium transporter CorA [Escherichia coli]